MMNFGGALVSIHGLIDKAAVGVGALFMPKYFREDAKAQTVAEYLQDTSAPIPPIDEEGDYEVSADTPVGELDAGFRVAQWIGDKNPTLIYHHGAAEVPFDYGFKRIFLRDEEIPANLVLVRAPFHRRMKDFQHGIRTLSNVVAMLAVSVCVIEQLVQQAKETESRKVVVAGTSLGGFITNLHYIHHNTADAYAPLLAGLAMDHVYLHSLYSRAVAKQAKDNPTAIESVLNFEEDFAAQKKGNVFPLLALHDQLVHYGRQKDSYGDCPVETIAKGHTTAALAYSQLRHHVCKHLK